MKSRTAFLVLAIPLAFAWAADDAPVKPASPPAHNVRAFGARGDGNNQFDDSAAIQACLDAAGSGKVVIPAGNYRCTRGLTIRNTTGATIEGDGLGTRIFFEGTFDEAIRCENNSLLTIRDLRIDGPATVRRGLHITQKDASAEGTFLENLHVSGFTDGLCVGADTDGDVAEVTVLHCWAVNAKNAGFCCGNGTGGNVLDIRFLGCIARKNAIGVLAQGTAFTWRDGSTGYNTLTDFRVGPTTAPLVISGVRSEHSLRFYELLGGQTFYTPITLESIVVCGFNDPDGCPIVHEASCPLTMRDVAILGGKKPVSMRLGFDAKHPLSATLMNVSTDSPNPFGKPGPHQNFTIIGGNVIQPNSSVLGNADRGVITSGITLGNDAAFDFGEGRRWGPDGLLLTAPLQWGGKNGGKLWTQNGGLRFQNHTKKAKTTTLARP